jgi:hypothetical protein
MITNSLGKPNHSFILSIQRSFLFLFFCYHCGISLLNPQTNQNITHLGKNAGNAGKTLLDIVFGNETSGGLLTTQPYSSYENELN